MTAKTATPLKIAGEVQMKALSHDMGLIRRENERLKTDRARLIEALRKNAQWFKQNRAHYTLGSAEPDQQHDYTVALLRELEPK